MLPKFFTLIFVVVCTGSVVLFFKYKFYIKKKKTECTHLIHCYCVYKERGYNTTFTALDYLLTQETNLYSLQGVNVCHNETIWWWNIHIHSTLYLWRQPVSMEDSFHSCYNSLLSLDLHNKSSLTHTFSSSLVQIAYRHYSDCKPLQPSPYFFIFPKISLSKSSSELYPHWVPWLP